MTVVLLLVVHALIPALLLLLLLWYVSISIIGNAVVVDIADGTLIIAVVSGGVCSIQSLLISSSLFM